LKKKTSNKKVERDKPKNGHGGKREGAGRNPIPFNEEWWEIAENLAHIQCTRDEIAGVLKIDADTLITKIKQRYNLDFSAWFLKHSANGKASLRRRLFDMAMNEKWDNTQAAIWLSKNYLGMKEPESTNQAQVNQSFSLSYSKDDLTNAKKRTKND
jgi:hypothetical protein